MSFAIYFFMLVSFLMGLQYVTGLDENVGIEIGSEADFRKDKPSLMRRERHIRDALLIETVTKRPKTSTTISWDKSETKPNDRLCRCNGCLQKDGLCRSIFFDWCPPSDICKMNGGTWCEEKGFTLWKAPIRFDPSCELARPNLYRNMTLQMFEVALVPLEGKGYGNVKARLTDVDHGHSSIALFPCTQHFPKNLLYRKNKTVLVQGYFLDDSQTVRSLLAANDVPSVFKTNATFFVALNFQDTNILESDVQKELEDQIDTANMAGALRKHWSAQMSIAVALVTCPGTSLNTNHSKVSHAFFKDVSNALGKISRGKIDVNGDVVEVVIACPANISKGGDVFSYYQAVNAKLKSDSLWISSQYKALVFPQSWMTRYGMSYSPGYLSFYRDSGGQDASNIMHEIGHNFGLDHASILSSRKAEGFHESGDCSSAMSKCGRFPFYTLASNWFLGFNTFKANISLDRLTSPVSVKITSYIENEVSGLLLTRAEEGKDLPAFTVSFLRSVDAAENKRADMAPWLDKVHVHELPDNAYGPTKSIAVLDEVHRTAYLLPDFSVGISVKAMDADSATVVFCKAHSKEEAKACSKNKPR
jgi:hypothetical protein